MSDVFEVKAKRIAPDQIEVIDASGAHVAGKDASTNPFGANGMNGGIHVMKMGPLGGLAGLLLLPILIPIAIIGFFLLAILAIFFGKAIFRSGMAKVIRR
jgi:hypothetical protein